MVDGQASKRCALLGDLLAAKLHKNNFAVRLDACPRSCCCSSLRAHHAIELWHNYHILC